MTHHITGLQSPQLQNRKKLIPVTSELQRIEHL